MQAYNANHKLTIPKEGMVFTLTNTATRSMEGYRISTVRSNKAHVPIRFAALRYPSGDRPQQFHISDANWWTPTGREGQFEIMWGQAWNDFESIEGEPAGQGKSATPDPH